MNERYKRSNELLDRALKTIPLASQTFSKSITQFPAGISPLFLEKGKGSRVWDVDGNEYIDFMNALLSVSIGYADPDITNAVKQQLDSGVSFSLPHKLEMDVSEMLVDMIPCAEKVRFGKNGTDATSAAVRIARAFTNRDHIALCGYHGWQDWYIGTTSRHLGVPNSVRELSHTFTYNDIDSLAEIFRNYPSQIAAVMLEPMNVAWPESDFLAEVKNLCHENGALLVFDETVTGCRFAPGGAQEYFGVTPDLATFGKGLANGFPLSAIVGGDEVMGVMEDIFFSGTFGGETASLAAAKAVLTKVRDEDVTTRLASQGQKVIEGLDDCIDRHGVRGILSVSGHPSWSIVSIHDANGYNGFEIKTLFLQEIFKRGIIMIGTHNLSYSHSDEDVRRLLEVYDEVLPIVGKAVKQKTLYERLEAEPLQPLFKVR